MEPRLREDLNDLMEAVINNPLIAEKIFEQAEFNDKMNLRLINRFWRDCTLEEWRSNSAAIRIMFPRKRTWYESEREPYGKKCPFVETFERMMEGRQGTVDWPAPFRVQEEPFRQVILINGIFSIPKCKGKRLGTSVAFVEDKLFKFLDKYGSKLDYLRLEKCVITLEEMKWIVQQGCPQLKTFSLELDTLQGLPLQPTVSRLQKLSLKTPQVTKLEISCCPSWYKNDEEESGIRAGDIFKTVPKLKSLKYSEGQYSHRWHGECRFCFFQGHYSVKFPITKGLCLPLANGKYLELEELDFQVKVNNNNRIGSSPHQELILGLSRYIELTQPSSFKKFRIELKFDHHSKTIKDGFAINYPILDQFFSANGHLLTHLQIEMRNKFCDDEVKIASHLTSYYLPNLTHLTVYIRIYLSYIGNRMVMGSASPVIEGLQGMPKLQVFRCIGPRLGFSPQNLPIELSEMKEFVVNCGDKLTVDNLRMILGWMKGVRKLALKLDEKTFPVIFEMAPQLEQLILLGKDGGLTEIEKETGKMWMGPMERARQEMEWNRRRSLRDQKSETESNDESEKEEEEGWTVVNRRQPKGKKMATKRKDTTFVYLPRRPQPTRAERYGQLVDDFTVFCKLQEIKSSVRIYRTKEFKYDAWASSTNSIKVEDLDLIEYKI